MRFNAPRARDLPLAPLQSASARLHNRERRRSVKPARLARNCCLSLARRELRRQMSVRTFARGSGHISPRAAEPDCMMRAGLSC